MKNLKLSFYSILVPIEETNEFILYSTRTGGLLVINHELGEFLLRMKESPDGLPESESHELAENVHFLVKDNYVVENTRDEREEFHNDYVLQRQKAKTYSENGTVNLTIGTTIVCNMGCPYCFEFVKPNKSLKGEDSFNHIIAFLEDMLNKGTVGKWTRFNLTWYGGEPLINKVVIEKLTPRILELCDRFGMEYHSSIITNGLLLDLKTWLFLRDHRVTTAQVTVDGAKSTHEVNRPVKSKGRNYEKILENLSMIPEGMRLVLRLNVDKKVYATFNEFLSDLKSYGIWPQKHSQVMITPAWLRTYAAAGEADTSERYAYDEYFDAIQDLRRLQLRIYNQWASENGGAMGKRKFLMPSRETECPTWVSPYGIVIDPEGNIHKCWETIHDDKLSVSHVSQGYHPEALNDYMDYDRFEVHKDCYNCPYLPVCDQLSCAVQTEGNKKPPCTYWKTRTESLLRSQYLLWQNDASQIESPVAAEKVNNGHANK